jgi:TonB family protein
VLSKNFFSRRNVVFDELVESRPHRDRSTGQMIVSIVTHTIIIAVSIRLTGAVAESVARPPLEMAMQLIRAPVRPATSAAPAPASARMAAVPMLPIVAPIDVAISIPPVPVSRGFDPGSLGRPVPNGWRPDVGDSAASDPRTVVTMLDADEPARYLDGPEPVYPPALRQVGVEGFVQLRYIVGFDGRAEPGSIRSLQSSNAAFEAPAIEAIARARFRPARLKGRVVRQLVEQIVRFTVQR